MPLKHGSFSRSLGYLFTLALVISGCGCGTKDIPVVYTKEMQFEAAPKMVIIVSFDGLRPDAVAPADAGHLTSMAELGTVATEAKTIVPSLTLPSHTSMLTGVGVEKHGITWNGWDPSKGLVRVTTIFDEAKRAGLRTAMVVGKEKFRHLDHPGSVDAFAFYEGSADIISRMSANIIDEYRPQLLFIHFAHGDTAGHRHGWMSSKQFDAIHDADQALGRLLQYLQQKNLLLSTAVIATADHGGSGKGHGDESHTSTSIPWFAIGAGIPKVVKIPTAVSTYDTAATAAKLLGLPIPSSWDGRSIID